MKRWLLLLALLAGCEARAGASIQRDGDGYLLTFETCGHPRQLLPIKSIVVRAPGRPEPVCTLVRVDVDPKLAIVSSWRYRSQPMGYQLRGCAPLEPGRRYEIVTSASGTTSTASFELATDGSVAKSDEGC
jgi:hypothetical protein